MAAGVGALALTAAIAVGSTSGCEILLGIDDIELGPSTTACWDPAGFSGRGCYRSDNGCKPTTHLEIINACTQSDCLYYDNQKELGLKPNQNPPGLTPLGEGGAGGDSGAGGSGTGGAGGNGTGGSGTGGSGTGGSGTGGSGTGGAGGSQGNLCSDLKPPIVYMTGSNGVVPVLGELGPIVANDSNNPITIVYQEQGSCAGMEAIVNGTKMKGTAVYWATPNEPTECQLDPNGTSVDIGACDVFATTCNKLLTKLPDDVFDYTGPIQAMTLDVPETAKASIAAISREAAYYVWGLGGTPPWEDEKYILRRNPTSGTQHMIAAAIDVPIEYWRGEIFTSSSKMATALKNAGPATADKTIGIYDVINRQNPDYGPYLRVLAFQARDQRCGFFPDSTPGGSDLANVRDGHYVIWGPVHLFIKVKGNAEPQNDKAKAVVDYLTGTRILPNDDPYRILRIQAQGALVPQCAMRVQRDTELGELKTFEPTDSCACFYEKAATKSTSCQECVTSASCPASSPFCNYGFCEPF